MFSLFQRAKKKPEVRSKPLNEPSIDWLKPLMPVADSLPRPDWSKINEHIERNLSHQDKDTLWISIAHDWVRATATHLKHEYTATETDNFILLSGQSERYNQSLIHFLERCRARLLKVLKNIADDKGYGKYVVMVFSDIDAYYDYVSFYGPQDGTYGLSSGMYLNYGYGHFVFQQDNLDMAELIAAHEMTHALLAHLSLPAWLDEGMAVNMEAVICGNAPQRVNHPMFELHWGPDEIQEFWNGDSFFRSDDGQQLSYQMAQVLVTNLSKDYETFQKFANAANHSDGGEAAMNHVYGLSLGDLAASFLGEGDWHPKPKNWPSTEKSTN